MNTSNAGARPKKSSRNIFRGSSQCQCQWEIVPQITAISQIILGQGNCRLHAGKIACFRRAPALTLTLILTTL